MTEQGSTTGYSDLSKTEASTQPVPHRGLAQGTKSDAGILSGFSTDVESCSASLKTHEHDLNGWNHWLIS